MALLAQFPAGVTDITVHGLHQWDYGRTLDINAPDLPAVVEVHFAHRGMTEAVVRVCSTPNGVASAAIPDICLEQTQPIKAWVYYIGEASGRTALTITLPVIARTRPAPSESIPAEVGDQYTDLISEVNKAVKAVDEQVEKLRDGSTVVGKAQTAETAETADSATKATQDEHGRRISTTYATIPTGDFIEAPKDSRPPASYAGGYVYMIPGVGRKIALRVAINDYFVDLGVVNIPATAARVYLPLIPYEHTVGDGSVYAPCLAEVFMDVDPTPGYYESGTAVLGFRILSVDSDGTLNSGTGGAATCSVYYQVLT